MARILLDLDNVIADQLGGFYRTLERDFPHIPWPERESLTSFNFETHFPEEFRETILKIRLTEGFFRTLPLIDGAWEGLQALENAGHDLCIVTAPTWEWKYCVPEKYAWVEEHLGKDWLRRLIITRDKTVVRGDILIDDAPEVNGAMVPLWQHVIFDQPYNRTISDRPRFSWEVLQGSDLSRILALRSE